MNDRRSQKRRSSNLIPIRPSFIKVNSNISLTASASKRSSSIPRPSFSATTKLGNGKSHESLLSIGTTPSKGGSSNIRVGTSTPQTTPNYRGVPSSVSKPYLKETRNLLDKNCTKEMMQNLANFLSDSGYPELVGIKEIQKIDKQNFIKYFNFLFQYVDRTYQLAPRFNEEELVKVVKDLGYCGTLTRNTLISLGTLHATSQVIGLLSWLADLVRKLMYDSEDDSLEMVELHIMMESYNAWCLDQPYELEKELRALYYAKHQIEECATEAIEHQIRAVIEERHTLEKKSSRIETLKSDVKNLERHLEELRTQDVHFQQRLKEHLQEEKINLQRLEETRKKITSIQDEISQLQIVAKNCKISVQEARKIKAEIADIRGYISSCSEQLSQVAKLVEKREMQLANIAAENIKSTRSLNMELINRGMIGNDNVDWEKTLINFLETRPKELTETENHYLSIIEKKERILAETSHLNMELKHAKFQQRRLDEEFVAAKTEREEIEQLYLSRLSELASLSAAPRSDPIHMRNQYEIDTLNKRIDEQKSEMRKQEIYLENTMTQCAKDLRVAEEDLEEAQKQATNFYTRLINSYQQVVKSAEEGSLPCEEILSLISKIDF